MKKVTLAFPTRESLWSFKELSKGINLAIMPTKNTITGLFTSEEVDVAILQFKAVQSVGKTTLENITSKTPQSQNITSFKSKMAQFLMSGLLLPIRW